MTDRFFLSLDPPRVTGQMKGINFAERRVYTKPDTDNLIKVLKDTMTKLRFWGDDAQVAKETIRKQWSKIKPGIAIEIAELGAKGE